MSSEDSKKNKMLDGIKNRSDDIFQRGTKFTKMASEKIDESIKNEVKKAKINPRFNELKLKTTQAAKSGIERSKEIQEKSPSIIRRFGRTLQLGFEKFIGTITIGRQYGKTSIDMLEQLAKLKELGIISDKEFRQKKKEILDRI